jgi:hypothetical protein
MDPSQAKGASLGLYQRFESLATLDEYFYSEAKAVMVKKYMVPFMTVCILLTSSSLIGG